MCHSTLVAKVNTDMYIIYNVIPSHDKYYVICDVNKEVISLTPHIANVNRVPSMIQIVHVPFDTHTQTI